MNAGPRVTPDAREEAASRRPSHDRIAGLAARLLDAPRAWIALVDAEEPRLLGSAGPDDDGVAPPDGRPPVLEFNRRVAASGRPLAVADSRAPGDPYPGPPEFVALLGVPWPGARGEILGALCVADARPRDWSTADIEALGDLAAATRPERGADFRLLADAAPVIIGMSDPGREGWSYMNRTGREFFGLEAGELGPSGLIHPADRAARAAAAESARRDRRPLELESRYRRADGAWRWLAERSVPQHRPDGTFEGLLITLTDVTGLKEFEEALRASEEHKRRLVEGSRDCLRELSPQGLLLSINEAGRILTESDGQGPLLGKPWVDTWPAEARAAVRAAIELARDGGVARFQGACPTDRGMPKWWDVIVAPVRDAEGRTVRLLSTARDITPLKQAEANLRRSREQFRGAFDAATIGMALVAPDGRWLQVNRALSEIVGFTEAELLATTFQALTHPGDLDDDLALARRVLDGEIPSYQLEKRYLHKSGRIVRILLSVSLVRDDDGRPLYFVAQVQDISRWRQAEDGSAPSPPDEPPRAGLLR